MKSKNLILIVALLISAGTAFGQEFSIGLKGGLNFANLDVSNPGATYDARTGWHAGAFALAKFGKVGIQPELLFSQQGSKVTYNTSQSFDSNFDYLNIPIMLKLYTVAGINLQVGPQFGFLTNDPVIQDPNGQPIKDAYKKSDVSLGLGAGWDLPLGLSVDVRYNLGLSEVNEATAATTKNQVWQVSAGYKLFKFGNSKSKK